MNGVKRKTRQGSVPHSAFAYTELSNSTAVDSRARGIAALPPCNLFNKCRPKPRVFMRASIDESHNLKFCLLIHSQTWVFVCRLDEQFCCSLNAALPLSVVVRRKTVLTISLTLKPKLFSRNVYLSPVAVVRVCCILAFQRCNSTISEHRRLATARCRGGTSVGA